LARLTLNNADTDQSDGGQGIASGFRDAVALAWRLKVACQELPNDYQPLFQGWFLERKQQLEQSLAATVQNGQRVTERNPLKIFVRDTYLSIVQLIPSWKRWLEQGPRSQGMCRYSYHPGLHFLAEFGGGLLMPQVYCKSVLQKTADVMFTDDVIFAPSKQGLFQLVILINSTDEIEETFQQLQSVNVEGLANGFIKQSESIMIIHNLDATLSTVQQKSLSRAQCNAFRIASASEFAESPWCEDRPKPRYYDPFRISKEVSENKFIILRPDRFVFAACAGAEELCSALRLIKPTLAGKRSS
jgi:hypothetical protein